MKTNKATIVFYGYNMGKLLAINPGTSAAWAVRMSSDAGIYGEGR